VGILSKERYEREDASARRRRLVGLRELKAVATNVRGSSTTWSSVVYAVVRLEILRLR